MHPYHETTLTGAGLRNGRIYSSAGDKPLFAAAKLGDRAGKDPSTDVAIDVHRETLTTEIRQVSCIHSAPNLRSGATE